MGETDSVQERSRTEVHLRLEMAPTDFTPRRGEFLRLVAATVGCPVEALAITDIRSGCVIVVIDMPADAAQDLIRRFVESALKEHPERLFTAFAVEAVREEVGLGDKGFRLRRSVGDSIDWLHLSDLHVRGMPEEKNWYDDLLRDIGGALEQEGVSPHFVVISGDVAFSGKPEEYTAAEALLGRLRKSLPNPDVPLVICPGNHDISWSAIKPESEKTLREFVIDQGADAVVSRIVDPASPPDRDLRDEVTARHANFREFLRRVESLQPTGTVVKSGTLAQCTLLTIEGTGVAVTTLNSALLSTRDDLLRQLGVAPDVANVAPPPDLGFLVLSDPQLREAYELANEADLRIAVFHHPPLSAWFSEDDHVNHRTWLPYFDFVHRGHAHVAATERRTPIGTHSGVFEVAAGALHTTPSWYTGFTAMRLDPHAGTARMTSWTFGERVRRWHLDALATRSGSEERALPEPLRRRLLGSRVDPGRG